MIEANFILISALPLPSSISISLCERVCLCFSHTSSRLTSFHFISHRINFVALRLVDFVWPTTHTHANFFLLLKSKMNFLAGEIFLSFVRLSLRFPMLVANCLKYSYHTQRALNNWQWYVECVCGNRKVHHQLLASKVFFMQFEFVEFSRLIGWVLPVILDTSRDLRFALSIRFDSIQFILFGWKWWKTIYWFRCYTYTALSRCCCWQYFNSCFLFSLIHHFTPYT